MQHLLLHFDCYSLNFLFLSSMAKTCLQAAFLFPLLRAQGQKATLISKPPGHPSPLPSTQPTSLPTPSPCTQPLIC